MNYIILKFTITPYEKKHSVMVKRLRPVPMSVTKKTEKKTRNRSTVDLGGGGGRNVMENLTLSFADDCL